MKRTLFLPLLVLCFLAGGFSSSAAPPLWWSNGNPPVIDPAAVSNNYGVANIGQAKWMAKNALEALRAVDPAIASAVEADLVGPGKPLASWAPPATPAEQAAQLAPLLVGQLKAIAAPFYNHLHTADAAWLDAERVANGADVAGTFLPWSFTVTDGNKAVANIGQLKAVFSLRFETLTTVDTDEDGLPDSWEMQHFGSLDHHGSGDFDGDGLTNLQEYQRGTNPGKYDSDGDGIADAEDMSPLVADSQPVVVSNLRVLTPLR
jgi:hypothetical protein